GRSRSAVFVRHHVVVAWHDLWLHCITCLCRKAGPQGNACVVLCCDAGVYSAGFWLCVLPAHACALGLHYLFTFSGVWWRQFCDVYAMAARAVSDRMPGKRFCTCDLDWPLRWGWSYVFSRCRCFSFSQHRYSRGSNQCRICAGTSIPVVCRRD